MYYIVYSVSYCTISTLLCHQSTQLWLQSAILRHNCALWFLLGHQMLHCAQDYPVLPPSTLLSYPIVLVYHHHALLWHQTHLLVTTEQSWFQMFYHLHTVCCVMILRTLLLKDFTVPLQCHILSSTFNVGSSQYLTMSSMFHSVLSQHLIVITLFNCDIEVHN